VVVVDDDAGRSLWSQVTRNYLGFPGGIAAADLRLLGQRQAAEVGATFRAGRVVDACPASDGMFRLVLRAPEPIPDEPAPNLEPGSPSNRRRERRHGRAVGERPVRDRSTIDTRTVIVATGVRDDWPVFPGRELCVGRSLFWCIVCDGLEARGRRVAVVGGDEDAIQTALGLRVFTDDVALVTGDGPQDGARLAEAAADGLRVVHALVREWRHADGAIECLVIDAADGMSEVTVDMVFVAVRKRPRSALARRLGAELDERRYVRVDTDQRTRVRGVFAAGDVSTLHAHQVSAAAHEGATAGTAANWVLYPPVVRGDYHP
jgi:thioredoxin reductase (NADPH)